MQQLPLDEDVAADHPCRVVPADQVAQLRATDPDTAIVALVRSIDPDAAVRARLAGADVVLPYDEQPSEVTLRTARRAARTLRHHEVEARRSREFALHDLRTGVQSTVMLADLIQNEPGATDRAVRLLRALADRNADSIADLARSETLVAAGGPVIAEVAEEGPEFPALAQAEILEGIARRVPLSQSLQGVVAAMEAQLPGSICSILLSGPDPTTLVHGAGPHLPEPFRRYIDGVQIGPAVGSCGSAAYLKIPIVAADIATDPRWTAFRDMAMQHGLRSCWSTPILDADRHEVLGTFAVYHDRPWEPDASDVELVGRFTHTAAIAIGTHALFSRLAESESRFRSAFEGAEVGMALVSPEGDLLQANPALSRMLGGAATGDRLPDNVHPDDLDDFTSALRRCAADGTPVRLPEVRWVGDSWAQPLWTTLGVSLVTGPDGDARYLVVELFDLTERRRVAQARREQAVAEAANQAKTEQLALVSHELRTPLTAVIGFAQAMQMVQLDPERREGAIERILTAGRHLLQVINDLSDLTGAETGRLLPDRRPFDPADTIRETVDLMAELAVQGGISLTAELPARPVRVSGDPRRLRQVLINLVGNAVKFTQEGGSVVVSWDGAALRVSDDGPGIPDAEIPLLFTPFHRSGTRKGEGTGLGLALSERLTRAMGGRLRRVPGSVGTTFEVRMPAVGSVARSATDRSTTDRATTDRSTTDRTTTDRPTEDRPTSAGTGDHPRAPRRSTTSTSSGMSNGLASATSAPVTATTPAAST
ncbi:GAF domain-containing protein [Nakamurella sp. YIM 132087]|uniref:histidine kinase n=1 Tax=Nakamurella alba TaxID=2665158 RepID=A0A7K1FIH1_9ACTN|nr:GAF domain-containing sensor histidine kinase [Nakamurella alba]MTD13921.1 GAF domain-containing protein [Nakamurella alba]